MSAPARPASSHLICVGEIRGAFGVRGEARIASFTADPAAVFSYGPLLDETGAARLTVSSWRPIKGGFAARAREIETPEQADTMRGLRLYVPRAALPAPEPDEFYHADLIGLAVRHADGRALGRVRAVEDFGAGALLEIEPETGEAAARWRLPFTRAFVPEVDLAGGAVTVDPPEGIEPDQSSGDSGIPPRENPA